MTRLRPVDRFQIVTTTLLLALGLLIVVRAGVRHAPIDSYGLGAAFVAYGLYRVRFILRALRRGKAPS
jgi:hypothetical protein